MKKLRVCLFILSVLAISLSCSQEDNVKYYRHLRLYKIHDLAFSYPIDAEDHKKITCYAVRLDENGRIVDVVYLRKGKPAFDRYNEISTISIEYSKNSEKRYYRDVDGKSIYKNVDYKLFNFDDARKLLSRTNYAKNGSIVEDTSGIARYSYATDKLNNVVKSIGLNINGDTTMDSSGLYEVRYKYDSSNNIREIGNYGKDGRLLSDKYGVAIGRYKHDENNNRTELIFFDSSDDRIIDMQFKASKLNYEYDLNGNLTRVESLDEHDNLLLNDSLGFASYEIKYNEKGDPVEISSFDEKGDTTIIVRFDELGVIIERVFYVRLAHMEQFNHEKYHYYIEKYDKTGNYVEYSFHNTDGSFYEISLGYASMQQEFDNNGNIIETRFYDADGKLISKSPR
ncbi:MAG: hypothetical protein V3U02_00300 [Calditrichia bacterium]